MDLADSAAPIGAGSSPGWLRRCGPSPRGGRVKNAARYDPTALRSRRASGRLSRHQGVGAHYQNDARVHWT
ncbi:hypothetical protein DIPPA_04838 [Diplonema papillatum]|nr:hypothetical protein DIPPA_04838 [Diplonema papillatum]